LKGLFTWFLCMSRLTTIHFSPLHLRRSFKNQLALVHLLTVIRSPWKENVLFVSSIGTFHNSYWPSPACSIDIIELLIFCLSPPSSKFREPHYSCLPGSSGSIQWCLHQFWPGSYDDSISRVRPTSMSGTGGSCL
jgi:hypothetical protein